MLHCAEMSFQVPTRGSETADWAAPDWFSPSCAAASGPNNSSVRVDFFKATGKSLADLVSYSCGPWACRYSRKVSLTTLLL